MLRVLPGELRLAARLAASHIYLGDRAHLAGHVPQAATQLHVLPTLAVCSVSEATGSRISLETLSPISRPLNLIALVAVRPNEGTDLEGGRASIISISCISFETVSPISRPLNLGRI